MPDPAAAGSVPKVASLHITAGSVAELFRTAVCVAASTFARSAAFENRYYPSQTGSCVSTVKERSMNYKEFASKVGSNVSASLGPGSESIIAILLPALIQIIAGLPCLANKSSSETRDWIEDHPGLSRIKAISLAREQNPSLKRREAVVVAEKMLEGMSSLSESDFGSVYDSVKAGV